MQFFLFQQGKESIANKVAFIWREYFLPNETIKILKTSTRNSQNVENKGLILNKFIRFNEKKKAVLPSNLVFKKTPSHLLDAHSKLFEYQQQIRKFNMSTQWRLIVGLGNESVYETSLTLHPIYGFPYIPGQALKGITRSLYIKQNIDKFAPEFDYSQEKANEKLEELFIVKSAEFREIFGNPKAGKIKENAGKVIFFDAFPTTDLDVTKDIINPHYSDYYGDSDAKIPPADYIIPVPVNFLTAQNATFQFVIGVKNKKYVHLLNIVEKYLREALTKFGVGAKTAVGYGKFN